MLVPFVILAVHTLADTGRSAARDHERAPEKRAAAQPDQKDNAAQEQAGAAREKARARRHGQRGGAVGEHEDRDELDDNGDERRMGADPSEADPEEEDAIDIPPPPDCDESKLRLSGTVYNPAAPERSLAMLHTSDDKRGAVYREGAMVSAFEVMSVLPRGVVLRSAEGECWLRLKQDPNKARPSSRSRKANKRKKKRKRR